jgi:dTDP-4-dehydrorhamnose 3,5-epimerase-like enzyme
MRSDNVTLNDCKILQLPKIYDHRGSLTYIEEKYHVPFEIKRIYYLYDVPGGESRAGHAHFELEQLLVAMSGSFDVTLDDAMTRQKFHLNRSYVGLFIPKMIWREIDNFSSGAVCMALASAYYAESDYIRDYGKYLAIMREAS